MNYNSYPWLHRMCLRMLNSIGLFTKKQYRDLERSRKLFLESWCDEEDDIRKVARPILGDYLVDGGSYGVPGSFEIVEELIKRIPKNNP